MGEWALSSPAQTQSDGICHQLLAFGMSFAVDFGTSKGLGLHEDCVSPDWDGPLLELQYTAIVLFNPALMATKTSILLLYLSIAREGQKFLRIGSYVTFAVTNIGGFVLTFITVFQCRPVQAAYNLAIENPRCISIESIYLASAPVNVATDLAILVLPIPVLTTLSLPRRQKTFLILSFLLGVIFVTVVDVARIYYVQLAANDFDNLASTKLTTDLEFSYNASMALQWSAIEVNVAIVCACVPTVKPLLKRLAPKVFVSNHVHSSGESGLVPSSSSQGDSVDSQDQPRSATSPAAVDSEQLGEIQERRMSVREDTELGTALQSAPPPSQHIERSVYFGFISMEQPKCMLDMRGLESAKYCALVAALMFLVGFMYAMLFSVSGVIPITETQTQALGISSTTYSGGIVSPLLGYWALRRVGFKATFVAALFITCVGTLMFWPSGALRSYPGFIVSTFVVGFAVALLDLTSNAFLALCGPPHYAEIRVLLGQAVSSAGATLSSLLSQKVFFAHVASSRSFIFIQWTYLAIALFTVLLGFIFYYMPLPEATDSDLRIRDERLGIDPSQKYFGRLPVMSTTLALAVLSGGCAAAALVCFRNFIDDFLSSVATRTQTSLALAPLDFQILLTALYGASEFVFAFLCLLIPPRVILLLSCVCGITFSALIMGLEFPSASSVESMTLVFAVFIGPTPNLVIAVALGALRKRTVLAVSLIESSIGLGISTFLFVMFAVQRAHSHSVKYSFCVVVALFAAATVYPLYLNLVRASRAPDRLPVWRAVGNLLLRRHSPSQV